MFLLSSGSLKYAAVIVRFITEKEMFGEGGRGCVYSGVQGLAGFTPPTACSRIAAARVIPRCAEPRLFHTNGEQERYSILKSQFGDAVPI